MPNFYTTARAASFRADRSLESTVCSTDAFRSWPGRESATVSLLAEYRPFDVFRAGPEVLNLDRNLARAALAVSGPGISTWHLMPPRGWGTVLPREDVAILVQESSGGLDLEFVDALQEPANRLVRIDLAVAAGHLGTHKAWMQDDHSDPSRLEVVGEGDTGRIECRLATTATV